MSRRLTASALLLAPLLLAGCVFVQPKPDGTLSFSLTPPASTNVTITATSSSSTGGASKPAAGSSGPALPGHELTSGPWKVNVETTEMTRKLPDDTKAASGKQFLLVNVSVRNVGNNAALIVRASQFRLIDTHGAEIKAFHTSLSAFNAQEVKPIDVGMGGFTTFVYEVPAGSSGYGFVASPKQGASGSMSWIVP